MKNAIRMGCLMLVALCAAGSLEAAVDKGAPRGGRIDRAADGIDQVIPHTADLSPEPGRDGVQHARGNPTVTTSWNTAGSFPRGRN